MKYGACDFASGGYLHGIPKKNDKLDQWGGVKEV